MEWSCRDIRPYRPPQKSATHGPMNLNGLRSGNMLQCYTKARLNLPPMRLGFLLLAKIKNVSVNKDLRQPSQRGIYL